jgi:hypothetical protein
MTEETAVAVSEVVSSPSSPTDHIFDFTITEWVAPSLIVPHKDEHSTDVKRRHQQEHVYRSKTSPTNWHRYLTLGRYSMSGPAFDNLFNHPNEHILKIHRVIWYNYAFHVDRNMECSPKLAAWAVQRSKPHLTTNQPTALLVDTISTRWEQYQAEQDDPIGNEPQANMQADETIDLTESIDTEYIDTQLTTPNVPPDEPPFDFTVTEWIDPPKYVTNLATSQDSDVRALAEDEYRTSTTSTAWHRYVTLGRYVVDGFTCDSIMAEGSSDPLKMHCMIWYQYSYHLDHKIDIPPKLQSWATKRSQSFLTTNAVNAFQLDTTNTTWQVFSRSLSLSNPWSEVPSKKKHKAKKVGSPKRPASTSALGNRAKPGTIPEEASNSSKSTEPRGQKRSVDHDEQSAASNGKQSVLIPDLNVPVCDGTYRITLRWKTSLDLTKISTQSKEMKEGIYNLLKELFADEDGMLYKWQQPGTDQYNVLSKMSPDDVRQFICPSIGIVPSQSMLVIPIRYGFTNNTPSKWRNLASTKTILEKKNVTVSISNCTSVSGDLVIAGYILLKAPMTTHRLRYLQSLRQQLPDTTPQFDILLHKRSPSDQLIPHLAVQCGSSHVHSLSEVLAPILTGDRSALYIPRFVFSKMSAEDAEDLFQTHDTHVKSLRWLSLSPLLKNLDKPRKEHHSNGVVIERSTREWSKNIKTHDGSGYANCDVVNGGTDQLAYLLFSPQHESVASAALEQYRRLLYPFTQREAQFRSRIGPPPVVHLSTSVIANLEFIKRLSSQTSKSCTPTNVSAPTNQSFDNSSASSTTVSSVSQATRPVTPAESVRQQSSERTQSSDFSVQSDDESTTASTVTATSKASDGRMSTSSAKIRELSKALKSQQEQTKTKEVKNSERVSHLERQISRLTDLEKKLDDAQTDFGTRLNLFESRMAETVTAQLAQTNSTMEAMMNANLESIMMAVNRLMTDDRKPPSVVARDPFIAARATMASDGKQTDHDDIQGDSQLSAAASQTSSSRSSMSAISIELTQPYSPASSPDHKSPEHKRLKSSQKKEKDSVRRRLDSSLEAASTRPPPPDLQNGSFDSLDLALQELDELKQMDTRPTVPTGFNSNSDPESQYNNASHIPHEVNDNNAISSLGSDCTS